VNTIELTVIDPVVIDPVEIDPVDMDPVERAVTVVAPPKNVLEYIVPVEIVPVEIPFTLIVLKAPTLTSPVAAIV